MSPSAVTVQDPEQDPVVARQREAQQHADPAMLPQRPDVLLVEGRRFLDAPGGRRGETTAVRRSRPRYFSRTT